MNIADAKLHPENAPTDTPWEKIILPEIVLSVKKQKEYTVWSRIMDGKSIFLVLPAGETPGFGGYFTLESALKQKGLLSS